MTDHEPAPVPWPGVQPAPFEFPYAEAAVARAALVELHTELTDCGAIHNNAFFDLSVGNQGATLSQFRSAHFDRLHAGATAWIAVIDALDDLDDLVARARVAEQERADAHAAWTGREHAYQQARADGHPVGVRPRMGATPN